VKFAPRAPKQQDSTLSRLFAAVRGNQHRKHSEVCHHTAADTNPLSPHENIARDMAGSLIRSSISVDNRKLAP
jgi:hypothetical protein